VKKKNQKTFRVYEAGKPWKRKAIQSEQAPELVFIGTSNGSTTAASDAPASASATATASASTATAIWLREASERIHEDPKGVLRGLLGLLLGFAAIAGGAMLGFDWAPWLFDKLSTAGTIPGTNVPLRLLSASLSVALFFALFNSVVQLAESALKHFQKFDLTRAAFDFAKALLAVLSFYVTVLLVDAHLKAESDEPLAVFPLPYDTSQPLGVFSEFFEPGRLQAAYWDPTYALNKTPVPDKPDIWESGAALGKENKLSLLTTSLEGCVDRSKTGVRVHLSVRGYASSRDFVDQNNNEHAQSDWLNKLLAGQRARSVHEQLTTLTRGNPLFELDAVPEYLSVDDMFESRGTVDRIASKELQLQEHLARRVDIVIQRAPGCTLTKLARLPQSADARAPITPNRIASAAVADQASP